MKRILLLFGMVSCWMSLIAQQPNIAPAATITCTGTQASFPPSTLNDLNLGTCGSQQFWMTSSSGSTTDYIEWDWGSIPQSFDEITFHQADATTARQLDGGVLQAWDGSNWVTAASFSNLPLSCQNTITFQRITTTKLRMTQMIIGSGGGQTTNVNFREIEIFQASVALDDAGVILVDSAQAACPGSYPVNATIQNFGINQIDSVMVNWSVDGTGQPSVWHKSLLDTIGGMGSSSATVTLGNYTFAANTNYTVKVWTSMPNSGTDTTNYNDTLSSVVRLAAPTGFMASNIQTTSADLSWNTLGASNFRITYGIAGFNPQSGGNTVTATGSTRNISSLSANTLYEAYLVADCGSGVYSDTTGPISFRTPCAVATAPFNENFDASAWVPRTGVDPCWTTNPSAGSTWSWEPRATGPTSGNGPLQDLTGGNFMYCEASISGTYPDAELISPPIDVSGLTTPGLYFFQHRYSGATIADMDVYVSNDFGSTWTSEYSITGDLQSGSADPWELEFVNLAAYAGDTIMVKFTQQFNGCCGDAAIDSVVVDEAPTCPWPTSPGVVSVTDSSAVITWNDPTGSAWEVIWGPPGFTQASPGSGTHNTIYNPDTINGLQSNTEYEYYVRTDCGPNGNSIWIGPIGFKTDCAPLMAPYFNNFDNNPTGVPPTCWGDYRTGTSVSFSQANVVSSTVAYSPSNILYLYNYTPINSNDTTMAVSPKFMDMPVGDKQLRFKAYSSTTSNPFIIIGTMTERVVGSSFKPIDTINLTTAYQEYIVPITTANGYNGTDEYFALLHGKSAIAQQIYIDDFAYEVIPPCPPPSSSSLGAASVGSNSATLVWGTGISDSTEIEVGTTGFTPGSGSAVFVGGTQDTFLLATGLSPQTTYDFYILDTCYGVGVSGWIGPFTFTTACLPASAPYLETFDGTSWTLGNGSGFQIGSVDPCWTRNPDADGNWAWSVYNSAPGSGSTGPAADFSGTGNFLYTDASYSNTAYPAEILSPLIDVSSLNVPYVQFYYHRYGDLGEMGDMEVAVNDGTGWVTMLTMTGTDQTATTDPWKEKGIDVSSFGDTIQVRFRGLAKVCCQGDMAIDQFEVKEAPSCPNLAGLTVGQIIDTAATASWTASGSAGSYEVWYGPQGFYQGTSTTGGYKGTSSTASFVFDTLSPNTCYEYLVRAVCGPGDTSQWAGPVVFCTPCSPVQAPYIENFDALNTGLAGDLGNCWVGSGSTSTYSWRTNSGSTGSASTGPNGDATTGSGIYLYTEASSGSIGDIATMTSPLVDVSGLTSPEMRFSYHMYGANIDTLFVDVFDGTQWNTAVLNIDEQQQSSSTDPWRDTLVDLSSYSTSGLVQVRFRLRSRGCCPGDAAIDDVEFGDPITCPSPSNFMVSSVSGTSATLTWNGVSSAQSYIVEYGPGGFTPGTGTSATVTGTTYGITNLPQNNIAYQAYVRAYCGGTDSSFWAGPVTIITDPNLCTDDFEVYNTGDIDGQSTLFIGWNGDGGDGEVSTAQASSGSKSLHIHTSGPNAFSDIVTNLDTSFTSGIHSLKFNMFVPSTYGGYYNILHNYTGPSNVWAIEVYIDANGTATVNEGSNGTGVIGTYSTTPNTWNTIEHIIDLDNDTAWVLVNGVNTNLGWTFSLGSTNMGDRFNAVNFYSAANAGQTPKYYVDDFCVQPYVPVQCAAPTTLNVSSTNIGCDSAEVSWVSQSGANSSILEYGPTGYTPGTGTAVPFVNSPYVITGLTTNTTYDFYVADTCANDTSSVAGPFSFTTTSGPTPHASFTWGSSYTPTTQNVIFNPSASVNADSLYWDFGNGTTASGSNPGTVSYSLPNTSYTVMLTVYTSCGISDDTTVTINTNIGLEDLMIGGGFNLYPNPNNGVFKVEFDMPKSGNARLYVTDVSGKEVLSVPVEFDAGHYERNIDLEGAPKGVYFINLETTHGKISKRFVRE